MGEHTGPPVRRPVGHAGDLELVQDRGNQDVLEALRAQMRNEQGELLRRGEHHRNRAGAVDERKTRGVFVRIDAGRP